MTAAVCAALAAAPAAAADRPRVTVLGDSVQASFAYAPDAMRHLSAAFDVRVDARACRRLIARSCGSPAPTTALQAIHLHGRGLGRTVVVNVGYNDGPVGYDVPAVVRALRARGVRTVLWVNLRVVQSSYAGINARVRAAARRDPTIRIVDWNGACRGRPWFTSDGIHLNAAGAMGLARLLRRRLAEEMPPPRPVPPPKRP